MFWCWVSRLCFQRSPFGRLLGVCVPYRSERINEFGCIACDKLEEVGAGEKEGWLSDPSVLTALHFHAIATATFARSLILVLGWDDSSPLVSSIKIWPSLSMSGARITVLEWLPFGDLLSRAVGTSDGVLLILSVEGDLIHKQIIHTACVLRLRFREMKGNSLQDADSQELSIVMAGLIARFDGSDIQSKLQWWFQVARSCIWEDTKDPEDESSLGRIPSQLWNAILVLNSAAFIAGQSSHRYYRAVTTGEDAVISAYMPSMDRSRSLVDTILSKVVPATFSTMVSFSKMIWRSDQSSTERSHVASQLFAKASPFTCLKDPPRKGEKLMHFPSGITDSLGRILLLDSQALVVVWLWKVWKMRTGPLLAVQCPKGNRILQPSTRSPSSTQSSYIPLEVFLLNGDSGQLSVWNKSRLKLTAILHPVKQISPTLLSPLQSIYS